MSVPGFVIVSDDEENGNVHTAVIDEMGNQKVVSLAEAGNYRQLSYRSPVISHPGGSPRNRASEKRKTQYKCDLCGEVCSDASSLRVHRHVKHKVSSIKMTVEFHCKKCGTVFLSQDEYFSHCKTAHPDEPVEQTVLNRIPSMEEKRTEELRALVIKDQTMLSKVASELQVLETRSEPKRPRYVSKKTYQCQLCNKRFGTPSLLQRHQSVHSGLKPFPCNYCARTYTQQEHLRRHLRTAHEKIEEALGDPDVGMRKKQIWRTCKACGQRFSAKHRYVEHLKVHINGLFECHLCDRKFAIKNSFLRHVKSHSGEKNFVCDVCSKSFGALQTLKNHKRLHGGSFPYNCSICDKGFHKKNRLMEHVDNHLEEVGINEKNKCDICLEILENEESLELHKKTHNLSGKTKVQKQKNSSSQTPLVKDDAAEPLPFNCISCLLNFKEQAELVKHCQIFHKCIVTNNRGESRYSCDPCNRDFRSREDLRAHLSLHDPITGDLVAVELVPINSSSSADSIMYEVAFPEQSSLQAGFLKQLQPKASSQTSHTQTQHSTPGQPTHGYVNRAIYYNQIATGIGSNQSLQLNSGETDGPGMGPKKKSASLDSSQNTVYNKSLVSGSKQPLPAASAVRDNPQSSQPDEIMYQIDQQGHLLGISENGTMYQVIATENIESVTEASEWPPTEQQMENGDLLLDIVSQGGSLTFLNLPNNVRQEVQYVIADEVSGETCGKVTEG